VVYRQHLHQQFVDSLQVIGKGSSDHHKKTRSKKIFLIIPRFSAAINRIS
jgi:hypothetical protein